MPRLIAFDAVFFLLPFAVYAVWLFATRGTMRNRSDWPVKTLAILALVGLGLLIGAVVALTQFTGAPPGSKYIPAHLDNGVLVPGRFEP